MDQPRDKFSYLLAAIRELDFAPAPDNNRVYTNKERGYSFQLSRTTSPGVDVCIIMRDPDGYWSMLRTGPVKSIPLTPDCVEMFKEWLRRNQYPVDKILRIRRLQALQSLFT